MIPDVPQSLKLLSVLENGLLAQDEGDGHDREKGRGSRVFVPSGSTTPSFSDVAVAGESVLDVLSLGQVNLCGLV